MEVNPTVNDQTDPVNDKSENEVVNNPEAVLAKNRQLLKQERELKERLDALSREKEQAEQDKLAASGKKDELIESLRKSLRDEQDSRKAEKNGYAYSVVSSKIKEAATKQGCVDGNAFIKLLEKDDFNVLQIGDNYDVNSEDLKRLVEAKKANLGFMFRKSVAPTSDVAPGVIENFETKPKSVDKMSEAEILAEIKRLDNAEKTS